MTASVGIKLDTKELDRIAKKVGRSAEGVAMRFAYQLEGIYKMDAPVDTSAMANSCYVEGKSEDDYAKRSSEALEANPEVSLDRHPKPDGNIIANVGPSVEYAAYVEFGTSRMAARPVLGQAVQSLGSKFNSGKEWEEIVK